MFKAEELYEELLGKEREELAYYISVFEEVLENGEPEEIEAAREDMRKVLDYYG